MEGHKEHNGMLESEQVGNGAFFWQFIIHHGV